MNGPQAIIAWVFDLHQLSALNTAYHVRYFVQVKVDYNNIGRLASDEGPVKEEENP